MLVLTPKMFAEQAKKLGPNFIKAARKGALAGAYRAIPIIHKAVGAAPPANPRGIGVGGAVNTGFYKRAWKAERTAEGARVYNTAPYASIIESGRRPGKMPPLETIVRWAMRRMTISEKEARRIAYPIALAIKKRGLTGRKVLKRAQPLIYQAFTQEVRKAIDAAVSKLKP